MFNKKCNKYYYNKKCKKCFYKVYQKPYNNRIKNKHSKNYYQKNRERLLEKARIYRLKQKI